MSRFTNTLFCALAMVPCISAAQETTDVAAPPTVLEQLAAEAGSLRSMVQSDVAGQYLDAVKYLPEIETRTVYYDPQTTQALRADRAEHLSAEQLESWKKYEFDTRFYYTTWFGTPMAAARPLDLIARKAGVDSVDGKRIADFGYGNIGQLRLLASIGAHCTGIDVNTRLHALYSFPDDCGAIRRVDGGDEPGSITLVCGQWPADDDIVEHVGVI